MTDRLSPDEETLNRGWLTWSHADSDCDDICKALVETFEQLDAVRAERDEWNQQASIAAIRTWIEGLTDETLADAIVDHIVTRPDGGVTIRPKRIRAALLAILNRKETP